jgi:hypothetical protein
MVNSVNNTFEFVLMYDVLCNIYIGILMVNILWINTEIFISQKEILRMISCLWYKKKNSKVSTMMQLGFDICIT